MVSLAIVAGASADHQDAVEKNLGNVTQYNAIKQEIGDLKTASKNGDTVWFTNPTMNGHMVQAADYVISSGTAISNEVLANEIGAYLYNTQYGM